MRDTPYVLKTIIEQDIKYYLDLVDPNRFIQDMYINTCKNSENSGLYQLILNGEELWFGTLKEINAIVKSMITRVKYNDFLEE